MSTDRYISESARENILGNNCKKIEEYAIVRKKIRIWYNEFGFDFPHSSENNFRDSWFHYRILYQEHSALEIAGQASMLNEHIQRAEKDSVIYFFQKISEALEFWYHAALNKKERDKTEEDIESTLYSLYKYTEKTPNSWVVLLQKKYSQDVFRFADCCQKIADKYILTLSFRTDIQKILHTIKNHILEIRMGGAHIQRLDVSGGYYDKFSPCFEQLVSFCNQYRIKELLRVSELVEELTEESDDQIRL